MPTDAGIIAIGSDHRAGDIVRSIAAHLEHGGWTVHLFGPAATGSDESIDYPDPALAVSDEVASGRADRGILICGSGIGMSMAANKVQGVRAALAHDAHAAEMSRRHNDANVLCLAAEGSQETTFLQIVNTWLTTDFEGGRHRRRVDKMAAIENRPPAPSTAAPPNQSGR